MEIKETVEILKDDSLRECGNTWDYALEDVIGALKSGYTLCKVDEAVEKMEQLMQQENEGEMYYYPPYYSERCIKILEEACK